MFLFLALLSTLPLARGHPLIGSLRRFEILEGNPNIDLPPGPRKLEGEDQSICRNGNQVGMKFMGLQPSSFRELLNTHL